MHMTIIADALAPYGHLDGISEESAGLAAAFQKAGHQVSCIIPFSSDVDVNGHALARRLTPIKVEVDGEPRSVVRYDGRTPDGVIVYLLNLIKDGYSAPVFCRAACAVAESFTELPDAFLLFGEDAFSFAEICRSGGSKVAGVGQIARVSAEGTATVSGADRVAFASHALAAGAGEGIDGVVIGTSPARCPGELDKTSLKAGFQMSQGLPVRDDVPLLVVRELGEGALRQALTRDIQVAAVDANGHFFELQQQYRDRLVRIEGSDEGTALMAADAAVVGGSLAGAQSALVSGALPIVDPCLADEVVSLEPSLETGSAILAGPGADSLDAGLGQLIGAFKRRDAFKTLVKRLPAFAFTWEKAVSHYVQLVEEVKSEKRQDEQ